MAILGSSSASGPPCGVSCSSSNCPWHLPMAPSLGYWGQDSSRTSASRRTSGSTGKRPSSTDDQVGTQALATHAAADLQAFSFDSTACASTGAAPAALGLLRSFSAPAAPAGLVKSAGLSEALAAPEVAAAAALLAAASKLSMADTCAAAATQQLRVSLQLQKKLLQGQHVASTLPDSPGPFWVSRRAVGATVVQQDDASQEKLTPPQSVAAPPSLQEHASPAAVASAGHAVSTARELSHLQQQVQGTPSQPAQWQAQGQPQVRVQAHVRVQDTAAQQQARAEQQVDMPVRLQTEALRQVQHTAGQPPMQAQGRVGSQIPVLQHAAGLQGHQQHVLAQAQQHDNADEPRTPRTQLQPELVAVLDQILQDSRHLHGLDQQCYVEHQHQQLRQTDPQSHQQQAALNSPMTPLPFIATTSRHSMCMRQPSFRLHAAGSPLSASLSSGGFAAWAPPLPSPAESPLARRLSERDDTGLPTSSPALQELLSSGGSRRQLRRGCSLDSRRSVSSPGSHTCVVSQPMQQQQQPQQEAEQLEAPWVRMRHSLRSVAHLLQQRQQHLQQQQQHQREVQQVDGGPWYRRFQLERRHTFSTAVEVSVTAGGAAAAVDTAVAEAAAAAVAAVDVAAVAEAVAAAVAAVDAGASNAAAAAAAVAGDVDVCSSSVSPQRQLLRSADGGSSQMEGVVSPSFASVGRLTSHRLSFCSGLSDLESESDAAEGDAADATAAVLCSSGAGGDSVECKPHQNTALLSSDSKLCSSS